MPIRLKLLGAAKEVGRAGLLLDIEGEQVLLDYGVSLKGNEPEFPLPVQPRNIRVSALSHAHLDHSGALPLLYVSARPPLLTTPLSLSLSELLIRDFMKLSKYYIPYELEELEKMKDHAVPLVYNEVYEAGELTFRMVDAGHIPGSSMIVLETPSFTIVYTGDYALHDTCLLRKGDSGAIAKADVLIMETTYAEFDHPPRDVVEKEFVSSLEEVLSAGGIVLIPAFAVGRAQEILCVLAKHGVSYPVYVDGMARRANELIAESIDLLRDPRLFEKALDMARSIEDWDDRKRALSSPSVIVSPAGMLKGGPSEYYMEKLMDDPRNAVFLVSFAIPETPARQVIETGVYSSATKKGIVKARVEWFDFSAHCGRSELEETIRLTKRSASIVLMHGEEGAEQVVYRYATESGRRAFAPSAGEWLEIEL
jgi:putative mRNA 3-end processing factor